MCGFDVLIKQRTLGKSADDISRELCFHLLERGPDANCHCHWTVIASPDLTADMLVSASVLHLRGNHCQTQPMTSSSPAEACPSYLLWNGEIFGDVAADGDMDQHENDTSYLFHKLHHRSTEPNEKSLVHIFQSMQGPFATVYYHAPTQTLLFGRDQFGRRSLIVGFSSEDCFSSSPSLRFSSTVALSDHKSFELPSIGIWAMQLSSIAQSLPIHLRLYPHAFFIDDVDQEDELQHKLMQQMDPSWLDFITFDVVIGNHTIPVITAHATHALDIPIPPNLTIGHDHHGIYFLHYLQNSSYHSLVDTFLRFLRRSVEKRVTLIPNDSDIGTECRVALLFSGGIDSTLLALLMHEFIPESRAIDLINVAFQQQPRLSSRPKNKTRPMEVDSSSVDLPNTALKEDFNVPDRLSSLDSWQELTNLCPSRRWNLVQVDVTLQELRQKREDIIRNLIRPKTSVLDDSLGCALWFAARAAGVLMQEASPYKSPAKVLLMGFGADELLAGYGRHRVVNSKGGAVALAAEVKMELRRIGSRNCGRDDRMVADHGREARFPYLDEDLVNFVKSLPLECVANFALPSGVGEKLLLRCAAWKLGLREAALRKKRGFQFGSRIAKCENRKEKGCDPCERL